MNELIKVENKEINSEEVQTINARELHEFLESKQDFSTWIKKRIKDYGFLENQDFMVFHKKMENLEGGRPLIEYYITLEMAKELAMVERNDKGREARKYFIEIEKKYKAINGFILPNFNDPVESARAWANEVEKNQRAQLLLEEQAKFIEESKPKIKYCELVLACPDLMTVTQVASDYGMSARKLNKILAEKGIQYKDNSGVWTLYLNHMNQGYAQNYTHVYQDQEGNNHAKLLLKWTQKGRLFIYDLLKEEGILPLVERDGYIPPLTDEE